MDEHHGFGIPHAGHQRPIGHAQMRAANLGLVLRYLRDHGGRSRAELAAETGLSKATITNVIAGLAGVGLIEEGDVEHHRRVGRPGIEIRLRPDGARGLGIELARHHLALSVVNFVGEPMMEHTVALSADPGDADGVVREAAELVRRVLDELDAPVAACTLAAPGLIDYQRGTVRLAPALGWTDAQVAPSFASQLDGALPIYIENDAKLAALSSLVEHRDAKVRDLVHVTGGAGIGLGVIADGRLLRGGAGYSGELGHTTLDADGPRCPCGRRGCLELAVGWPAFCRRLAQAGIDVSPDRSLGEQLEALRAQMQAGDEAIASAAGATAEDLARGLQSVVDLFNPKVLVLGGYFGYFGELLVPVLQRRFDQASIDPGTHVDVTTCGHGLQAAARGGAVMALERVFLDPTVVRAT